MNYLIKVGFALPQTMPLVLLVAKKSLQWEYYGTIVALLKNYIIYYAYAS